MCGRYSLGAIEFSQLKLPFVWPAGLEVTPNYNIAPSYREGAEAPILVHGPQAPLAELRRARFWFIPHFWHKPLKELPTTFNARIEHLSGGVFWRESSRRRRCLVPATGWREFRAEGKLRQPYHFHFGQHLFAFAGVWDEWASPAGEVVTSFAIVTVPAVGSAAAIHPRMPWVLAADDYRSWLTDPSLADPQDLWRLERQRGSPEPEVYPSDPRGNSVHAQGAMCIAPVGPGVR